MIEINEKFDPLWQEKTRYYLITGERGSSKSFSVNLFLTLKLLQKNQSILFTRYTLTSAKDSIIPEFQEKIKLLNLEGHFDIQRHDITNHSNGSHIIFRGIRPGSGIQTAKQKGLTNLNIWVIDEAEELTDPQIFKDINLSVRSDKSKNMIIMILNPASRSHWIYKRYYKNKVPEDYNGIKDDVTYIYMTVEDNIKNIDPVLAAELMKLKKEDPLKYKKTVSSSWQDESDEIVFNEESLNYYKDVNLESSTNIAWCDVADQGIDYLCFIVGCIVGNNIYIVDVVFSKQESQLTHPEIIKIIEKYNVTTAFFESNGMGLQFMKSLKKDYQGNCSLKAIRALNQNKHSRIVMQSDYIIENFHFKKNTHSVMYQNYLNNLCEYRKDKKVKNDDAADATAGLSYIIRKLRLIEKKNKIAFTHR